MYFPYSSTRLSQESGKTRRLSSTHSHSPVKDALSFNFLTGCSRFSFLAAPCVGVKRLFQTCTPPAPASAPSHRRAGQPASFRDFCVQPLNGTAKPTPPPSKRQPQAGGLTLLTRLNPTGTEWPASAPRQAPLVLSLGRKFWLSNNSLPGDIPCNSPSPCLDCLANGPLALSLPHGHPPALPLENVVKAEAAPQTTVEWRHLAWKHIWADQAFVGQWLVVMRSPCFVVWDERGPCSSSAKLLAEGTAPCATTSQGNPRATSTLLFYLLCSLKSLKSWRKKNVTFSAFKVKRATPSFPHRDRGEAGQVLARWEQQGAEQQGALSLAQAACQKRASVTARHIPGSEGQKNPHFKLWHRVLQDFRRNYP